MAPTRPAKSRVVWASAGGTKSKAMSSSRFVLVDRKARHFSVERMCYRSWHDGWLSLEKTGPLEELAEKYLPHLTQESFYDLWPH